MSEGQQRSQQQSAQTTKYGQRSAMMQTGRFITGRIVRSLAHRGCRGARDLLNFLNF